MTDALKVAMALSAAAGTLLQYELHDQPPPPWAYERGKTRKAKRSKKKARQARRNARRKNR